MPIKNSISIDSFVKIALEDPEFSASVKQVELQQSEIKTALEKEGINLFIPIEKEVIEHDNLEAEQEKITINFPEINRDVKRNDILTLIKGAFPIYFFSGTFLALSQFFGNWFLSRWIHQLSDLILPTSLSKFWSVSILYLLFFVVFISIHVFVRWRIQKNQFKRSIDNLQRLTIANQPVFDAYLNNKNRIAELKESITKNLLEKSIKEKIRTLINERLEPSYETQIKRINTKGLGEVIDLSKTIDTSAKKKLDFLLNTMPGGSIGIAGPRGAGKSTLIKTYCNTTPSFRKKDKDTLPIFTTAPVKYEFRDFALHLFSLICDQVLKKEVREVQLFTSMKSQNQYSLAGKKTTTFLNILSIVSIYLSITLLISGSIFWKLHNHYNIPINEQKNINLSTDLQVIKSKKDSLTNKTALSKPKNIDSLQTQQSQNIIDYYFRTMSSPSDRAANLITGGLICLLIWINLNLFYTSIPFILYFKPKRLIRYKSERHARQLKNIEYFTESNSNKAQRYKEQIKFQQSYTTGWSGALKFPIGLESSYKREIKIDERAMSNPQIIAEMSEFLNSLAQSYQIIIGIDELDKMESEVQATDFLNEIKSIFGIENCFFLISVSENAMHSFERRGMPFRDIFDSSFDNIIYLDYLDLESTISLLQRRVIGRPMPLFFLTYCLTGGLPRDVIRVFRELCRIIETEQSLKKTCEVYFTADIRYKLLAIKSSVKLLPESLVTRTKFINLLEEQDEIRIASVRDLNKAITTLLEQFQNTEFINSQEKNIVYQLKSLLEESLAYLSYALTVWEIFKRPHNQQSLQKLVDQSTLQKLARAKQSLANDFTSCRIIIQQIRNLEK